MSIPQHSIPLSMIWNCSHPVLFIPIILKTVAFFKEIAKKPVTEKGGSVLHLVRKERKGRKGRSEAH